MRTRLLLLLAALAVALGLGAPAASAHDVLISTSPKDGSTVATAPSQITLTFNNPAIATGSEIHVQSPDGRVDEGKPEFVDHVVKQPLKAGAPAGAYTVTWRVTSIDGHPISGSFRFTATAAAPGAATSTASQPATSGGSTPSTTAPTATAPAVGTSGPTPAPASEESEDGPNLLVILVGVLAVGAVIGAVVGLARRRTSSATTHTHDEDEDD